MRTTSALPAQSFEEMSPRDKHWPRSPPRRKRPAFYCLILLLLSSIVLFRLTYRNFSALYLTAFGPSHESGPPRGFSIQLHPKDHVRRLPTSLTHHWNITKGLRAPDGVNKTVYLINGGQY
jgi:hypothetical protein